MPGSDRNHPLAAQVGWSSSCSSAGTALFTRHGPGPAAGITWVLAIVGLVLVVRAALIPLFVKQIKSQRKMLEIAPELKKIQEKYKGKKDQLSREAMCRETMELYKKHGHQPAELVPAAARADADLLRAVLCAQRRQHETSDGGVGLLNAELAESSATPKLFGVAPCTTPSVQWRAEG